eukprot:COSAG01_NODE_8870_length_2631_cov_3.138231_3_plen_115_part_00
MQRGRRRPEGCLGPNGPGGLSPGRGGESEGGGRSLNGFHGLLMLEGVRGWGAVANGLNGFAGARGGRLSWRPVLRYGRYRDKLKDADFYQFAPLHPKLISAMDQVLHTDVIMMP